uniref:Uncharacterized protein n=1 Tax=Fagus sylvatica TaxID=28930 RepID=A0A2N9GKI4_FAGSY
MGDSSGQDVVVSFIIPRSLRLYLGGKGKSGWLLGMEKQPVDVSHAFQAALGLSVVDYFGYLQSRWEELTQYEPLSDLPPNAASIVLAHLTRQYTYQILMGLKPEFESLCTQILNTSLMPSLYEAYVTIDSDERRRHLGLSTHATISASLVTVEQMVFAANSGPRPPSWRPTCHHCAIVKTTGNSATLSDFSRLQAQIGTPTTFHVRSGEPTWVLDSGANDHMTGESSIFSSPLIPVTQSVSLADGSTSHISHKGDVFLSSDIMTMSSKKIFGEGYERDGLFFFGDPPPATSSLQAFVLPSSSSYVSDPSPFTNDTSPLASPVLIFDSMVPEFPSPSVPSSHPPLQVYTRRPRSLLPASSLAPGSGMSFTPLVSTQLPPPTLCSPCGKRLYPDSSKDFGATFAPVAKLTSVRLLMSLAASHSWPLHQLDVKNAFLHGNLLETIYMDPPPGFQAEGEYAGKVCRLRKSFYGLKQSSKAWFSHFSEVILSMEFVRCPSDHTCFIRRRSDGRCIILLVYMDDIILIGDDTPGITHVKERLGKNFDVKDLSVLKYFLGIEVARSCYEISLSQKKYTLDLL